MQSSQIISTLCGGLRRPFKAHQSKVTNIQLAQQYLPQYVVKILLESIPGEIGLYAFPGNRLLLKKALQAALFGCHSETVVVGTVPALIYIIQMSQVMMSSFFLLIDHDIIISAVELSYLSHLPYKKYI